ncbi:hypothetical protein SAMN05428988_6105 [Chitinophaga sp. YR573]|uniref:hypothetical protein n=1 Tax=Chitinophaga sp. YR573 TaxID=1881040 RepID=UPI0008B6EE06|nr:hypothetical protein [Chitinophaga sp. YR573]SEW45718.1 hypothetical protein SAMN05428988_6105 [Chitinophaga sp. YR573]
MNIFQLIARSILRKSFHLSVWTIEQFYDIALYEEKARQLNELPDGTLGKEIAACLKRNNLRLVPGFESHDLKHVLLGFEMTAVHEIRLQAFMLGNGNLTIPSFSVFIFGALFLPELWYTFCQDFKNGYSAKPISSWTIEDFAHCEITTLREAVFNYAPVKRRSSIGAYIDILLGAADMLFRLLFNWLPDASWMVKAGAYIAILLGASGMLFCLPFLFSSSMADIVGAGFPFVGGAIIAGAGLIALSNVAKSNRASYG